MKSIINTLTFVSVILLTTSTVVADSHDKPQVKTSAALNKMKQLVGTWKGTGGDMGDGTVEVQYRLSSGGSTVIETISPGTPHEMTTIYFDEAGKLSMTHYCALGNHPTMELKKETANELKFEESAKSDLKDQPHMHSLDVTLIGPNTIEQKWSLVHPGKEGHSSTFKLQRVS